jgi:AraC-like DNA-binding protein
LETLARVVAGEAAGPEARRRLAALYARLREGGAVARVWDTAEGLVDRWTNAIWLAEFMRDDRAAAGLQAPPTIALAVAPRQERGRAADGIELAIRGHDLQRRCVALARAASDTVCGRLPGGGVFLLARTKDGARAASIRLRMAELAGKVRRCGARELGLDLRVGVGTAKSRPEGLPESFDEALLALQCGMQAGRAVTFYMEIAAEPKVGGLYAAVRALRDAVASGSTPALEIGCDRLLRDAMVASRGDRGRLAAYLESALYRLVEVLERREVFDPRQLDDLVAGCRHALEAVHSVYDLPRAFAAKVAELAAAVSVPARSRRDAKLERARRFIEKNFDGPLPRARAAREAGLSPDYFASLFKQHVGMGFEAYLIRLRLERAAELLRTTDLAVKQIAREAGFGSYPHFFHAWKKAHGITPLAHRAMKSVLRIAE